MQRSLVILITGCSSGFGRLMVEPLAREGHTVYATLRDVSGRNASVAGTLSQLSDVSNLRVQVVQMDVTSTAEVQGVMARIEQEAGRIDVVVNNAAYIPYGIAEAFSVAQFQRTMETNVTGAFRVDQAALPMMRRQRSGLLMHISSVNGRLVMPFLGLYGASKFALEAFAEALRYELSALGIDSVIVEPGPFRTGIHSRPARAEEQACLRDYGPIAQAERHVLGDLQQAVAAPNVPTDPQLVVDAVLRLIATPAGERPLRTVVGMDFGVTQLNDATAHLTDVALTGMGLSQLQSIKTANAQP